MTLGELRKAINGYPDDMSVYICVETPGGFVCPDGAIVDIRTAVEGMDWHMGQMLITPKYRLSIKESEIEKWKDRK